MRNLFHRICNFSVTSAPVDLLLLRGVGWVIGLGVLVLVTITLPRHATNTTELSLGLGLAVLNCLVAILFSNLSYRVQSADMVRKIPWRSRLCEWSSYIIGVAVFLLGMWFTAFLPLSRVGFIGAFLLILAIMLATFCVGLLLTLIRHKRALNGLPDEAGPATQP